MSWKIEDGSWEDGVATKVQLAFAMMRSVQVSDR